MPKCSNLRFPYYQIKIRENKYHCLEQLKRHVVITNPICEDIGKVTPPLINFNHPFKELLFVLHSNYLPQ